MFEVFSSIPWQAMLIALGGALFRSFFGWLENAMKDQHISNYELAELGATVVRIFIITLGLYFPLHSLGIEAAELASAGAAIVFDFLLYAMKKQKKIVIEDKEEKPE